MFMTHDKAVEKLMDNEAQ